MTYDTVFVLSDTDVKGGIPEFGAQAQATLSFYAGAGVKFEFNKKPVTGGYTGKTMQIGYNDPDLGFQAYAEIQFSGLDGQPWRFTDQNGKVYTGTFAQSQVS